MSVCNVRLSGQILAWNEAPHWGKRKKIGVGQKKKKIGEQSEPRGSLGSFPHPQAIAGLASLADTFPIWPRFLPFSRSLVPAKADIFCKRCSLSMSCCRRLLQAMSQWSNNERIKVLWTSVAASFVTKLLTQTTSKFSRLKREKSHFKVFFFEKI